MAGFTKIHDFVFFLFQCLYGPRRAIFEKKVMKILKIEKKIKVSTPKGPKKIEKIIIFLFFFQKIIRFLLESEFYMFLAFFFEVYNICFAQNFQIFIIFAIKFPSKSTFILKSPAAKIVIKGGYLGYLWTAKDQNIYLRSILGHIEVF